MYTIDRYMLRQFFRVFLISFVSLMGIYMVGDIVNHLSDFTSHGESKAEMWRLLAVHYGARVPWFFEITGRIVALLAAVLTISWMKRHNEQTALMAAGISTWRTALPLVVAAVVLSLLGIANRELAVPAFRQALCRDADDLGEGFRAEMQPCYDNVSDIFFDGQAVSVADQRLLSPQLRLPNPVQSIQTIRAMVAQYFPADGTRPAGYVLENVESAHRFAELDEAALASLPYLYTPKTAPWLASDQLFVISCIAPEQFSRARQWQQFSSTTQLIAGLHNRSLDYGAPLRVMLHSRFVQPVLDLALFFLGLPIAISADQRHIFAATGKCLLMIAFFAIVVLLFQGLGIHCLISPALAAWGPVLILVPLAVAISHPMRS